MKIFKYASDIEQAVLWRGAFNEEDLQSIDTIGEYAEFTKGVIGPADDESKDLDIRDVNVTWIQPDEDNIWLFKRINEIVAKINYDKFQLDLISFDGIQFSKYKSEESSHYKWHIDSANRLNEEGYVRKLSLIVMLSKQEEYEGGNLLFNFSGNPDMPVEYELERGDMLLFYSHIPHTVTNITAGERKTLVTWVLGPKLK